MMKDGNMHGLPMCFELLTFGKDEVASSNLASSSKKPSRQPLRRFFFARTAELATSSVLSAKAGRISN